MKRIGVVCVLVGFVIVSLVCAPPDVSAAQQQKEIVFAFIDALSGPFKEVGIEGFQAMEYAVEQINAKGGLLGKPVKLLKYDNQFKPDIAVRMAKKAVLEDGAKVIFQQSNSGVALALSKVAKELNVIHMVGHAEADEITGSEFQPNTFRTCFSTSMHSGLLANYFSQTPYKRYYLINMDYAFGHAVSESFKKVFQRIKNPEAQIVGDDFHPIATKDFGPYITKALAAKPDVIITGNFGPDLTGLIKQARTLGLKAVIGTYYLDTPNWINQVGDAGLGAIVGEIYLATAKVKANQDFVKSWQSWFKKAYPSESSVYHVPNASWHPGNSALFAAEAIRRAGSAEADKLIAVMEGMVYDGPAGKMTMRACDHQIQADGWIAVVKADHQFKNIFKFPYLGEATRIPVEKISVAPKDTGNPRCK